MSVCKLVKDGLVAVLYSPGYGSGWYSHNTDYPECLFDPKIIELVEQDKKLSIPDYCLKKYGLDFFSGGYKTLRISWIPVGTRFTVQQYDGHETIMYLDDFDWVVA